MMTREKRRNIDVEGARDFESIIKSISPKVKGGDTQKLRSSFQPYDLKMLNKKKKHLSIERESLAIARNEIKKRI